MEVCVVCPTLGDVRRIFKFERRSMSCVDISDTASSIETHLGANPEAQAVMVRLSSFHANQVSFEP